ncbi:hypothetical protein ABXV23_18065 [Vibrio owensii]|uniref:hypothetical protein n=1 Tax=Vibrio owensii TaxID=696485 RepID=UPI003392787B
MTEKIRIPVITDTVMIDGHYQEERRSGEDRRKNKKKWHGYERRLKPDPRRPTYKSIDEEV